MIRHATAAAVALAACLILTSCGSDAAPSGPTAPSNPTVTHTIAVLGDSLSVYPSARESFPAILDTRLRDASLPWTVVNAGRNGDTTAGGLARLDGVLAQRPAILIVSLGANDGLRGVPVSTVSANLATIVRRAQAQGVQVLLCGMETPPFRGWDYTLAFHGIYPEIARQFAVPLVPFLLTGVVGNPDLNGDDLIHPNAEGARRIADSVWPYLEPLVRRGATAST